MQLFKYLNRKTYNLFVILAFLLLFSNSASAHTITSNINSAKSYQQVIFTSVLTFAGQAGMANGYINYGDGTAEETLVINLAVPMSPFFTSILLKTYLSETRDVHCQG